MSDFNLNNRAHASPSVKLIKTLSFLLSSLVFGGGYKSGLCAFLFLALSQGNFLYAITHSIPARLIDTTSQSATGKAGVNSILNSDSSKKALKITLPTLYSDLNGRSFEQEQDCSEELLSFEDCLRKNNRYALVLGSSYNGLKTQVLDMYSLEERFIGGAYANIYDNPYGPTNQISANYNRLGNTGNWNFDYPHSVVLDTPSTLLHWSKGPFASNFFHVSFLRSLNKSLYFGLNYQSATAESFPDYEYSFQVPLAYKSLTRRDSSDQVIGGNFPGLESTHLRSRIGYLAPGRQNIEFFLDHSSNSTPLHHFSSASIERGDYFEAIQNNLPSQYSHTNAGIIIQGRLPYGSIRGYYRLSNSEQSLSWLPTDSASKNLTLKSQSHETSGELLWGIPTYAYTLGTLAFWNRPEIPSYTIDTNTQLENLILAPQSRYEDYYEIYSSLYIGKKRTGLKLTLGYQGGQLVKGKAFEQPFLYADFTTDYKFWGVHTFFTHQINRSSAHYKNLLWLDLSEGFLGSEVTTPATNQQYFGQIRLGPKFLNTQLGYSYLQITASPLPKKFPRDTLKIPSNTSLVLDAYSEVRQVLGWGLEASGGGLYLSGHWGFLTESQVKMEQDPSSSPALVNTLLPQQWARGVIEWQKKMVDQKLKLSLINQWTWVGKRFGWGADSSNIQTEKLDEHLMLDFLIKMNIKTFTLIYEIRNLYNDRYYQSPGNHPPGVNFRYSILWRFSG